MNKNFNKFKTLKKLLSEQYNMKRFNELLSKRMGKPLSEEEEMELESLSYLSDRLVNGMIFPIRKSSELSN